MIELIFAIVLIAVVMLTIPTMIQVNNKALEGSAAQEAIFLVSSVLSEATTLLWDANSLGGSASAVSLSKILDVNGSGNAAYDRWDQVNNIADVNSTIRQGGLNEDLHRQFFSNDGLNNHRPTQSGTTALVLTGSFDSTATGEQLGLKNQYSIVASRIFVDDNPTGFAFTTVPAGKQTNIKMTLVEINATIDGTNSVISRLRAYTCNIGEIDYAKRRF
ncbi:MAG: hypothetical protein PF439_06075 [Helicobacteraceae bacterium]|nr:hypothetical protein [Helicobacteraceae bacterium]